MKWASQAMELHRGRAEKFTTDDTIKADSFTNSAVKSLQKELNLGGSLLGGFGGDLEISKGATNITTGEKIPLEYRRDVVINHLNRKGEVVKQYILYKAFPISFTPASDFASDSDDILSMESITLAYESFQVIAKTNDSNPFDIRDIAKRGIRRLF